MEPGLKCKLALINNAVAFAGKVGLDLPRVALIAAVEVVYTQMQVTMDAAVIAKMGERKQIEGAFVDGPLSFDVAISTEVAHSKGIAEAKGITNSPVAGQADILIAPNIETANGIYKAVGLYGKAEVGGVICGGKTPVILSSRSETVKNRLNSIVLGVISAAGS